MNEMVYNIYIYTSIVCLFNSSVILVHDYTCPAVIIDINIVSMKSCHNVIYQFMLGTRRSLFPNPMTYKCMYRILLCINVCTEYYYDYNGNGRSTITYIGCLPGGRSTITYIGT